MASCEKGDRPSIDVMVIAARFPSVIQTWLITQLVEIKRNFGAVRILARESETDLIHSTVSEHGLDQDYSLVPYGLTSLVARVVRFLVLGSELASRRIALRRFWSVIRAAQIPIKLRLYSIVCIPEMGQAAPSVIHCHSDQTGTRLFPLIFAYQSPLIATFHGLMPSGVPSVSNDLRRMYLDHASLILVNTNAAKEQCIALGGSAEKIRIVPQGTMVEEWDFVARSLPTNPDDQLRVVSIGRLDLAKGHQHTIEALTLLREQGINAELSIVGSGPAQANLEQTAARFGVAEHVIFHGLLANDKLQSLYSRAHVCVLSSLPAPALSWQETQGVVLQEAQASGIIVIGARSGGIPECIDDGETGFLVEPGSARAISDKLIEVLAQPSEWPRLQANARKQVEDRFCSIVIGRQMVDVYKSIAASNHEAAS